MKTTNVDRSHLVRTALSFFGCSVGDFFREHLLFSTEQGDDLVFFSFRDPIIGDFLSFRDLTNAEFVSLGEPRKVGLAGRVW